MPKISQLPQDSTPSTDDYVVTVDSTSGQTRRVSIADYLSATFGQDNIPSVSASPILRHTDYLFDFVASGCDWSGDAYASTRAASMTSGVVYINGKRLTVAAVTARSFTASKDTYVDFSDNGDGTASITYTEVTNNAASPALTTNYLRNAIIVTGASNIAAAGSVNQGQQDKVLPIASSVPYAVTDSLGNLICPRDVTRRTLGYRQITSNQGNTGGPTQITGLSVPVIVPLGRKIKVSVKGYNFGSSNGVTNSLISIWDGTVSSGTQIGACNMTSAGSNYNAPVAGEAEVTPTTASKTYNIGMQNIGGGTSTISASSTAPCFIKVELV